MSPTLKQEQMDGGRSASPDNMNALETSDTSDSGPTVGEKPESQEPRKESKVVSLADGPETSEEGDVFPPRRRSKQGTRDTQRSENPSLARRVTELFVSERPVKHEPTWKHSALAIVKASWLNVLLVFIPIGWATSYSHVNDTLVFVFKFVLFFLFLHFDASRALN
jgi:Ca2+:H+ antiporter